MASPDSRDADPLLTEKHLSRMLSISPRTLQAWRMRGFGPAFVRIGRSIRYRQSVLTEWMKSKTCQPQVR
jgi:predicted DNA-binding transcriptional regulator AlpA